MTIKHRLYFLLLAILLVILAGSIGYYLLFSKTAKFIDCIYMTVISLTSVGYGEVIQITGNVTAQIFTMILITFGMGIILYAISTLTAILIEGELSGLLRKKKMDKMITKLKNHYIVCGGGETGRPLLDEMIKCHESVVLVEEDIDKIEMCRAVGNLLYVQGDATDDKNLIAAGIKNAAGIIITLPSDKDNLYVTMTARMLHPSMRIITRLTDKSLEPKLKKAGADRVVSPNIIGALRMASEMLRPAAVDFLDTMLRSGQGNLRIHEIPVTEKAHHKGKTIAQTSLTEKYDILILGIRNRQAQIEFNPPPDKILEAGISLIVMGSVDDIAKAKLQF